MKPAEGTILTVSRMAAAAATEFAKDNADIELMFDCLLSAAKTALAETIHQNPVLERAGVVDAGGQGFVVVMDAMLAWLQGRAVAPVEAKLPEQEQKAAADFAEFDTAEIHFTYCTEFIAARESQKSPELLRTFLENIGDCVVVVSDEEIVKVHVHTNVPGEVLTEALTYGPLQTVKIENMRNQHTVLSKDAQPDAAPEAPEAPAVAPAEKPYGIVAVCAGDGMNEIFHELGADRVVTGGQTMNPSTEDILREVDQTPAETVFVLPNNKNIIMAAEQCVDLTEKRVVVVPTKTVPQGTPVLSASFISELLHVAQLPKQAAVIHCRGHQQHGPISFYNNRADHRQSGRPPVSPVFTVAQIDEPNIHTLLSHLHSPFHPSAKVLKTFLQNFIERKMM